MKINIRFTNGVNRFEKNFGQFVVINRPAIKKFFSHKIFLIIFEITDHWFESNLPLILFVKYELKLFIRFEVIKVYEFKTRKMIFPLISQEWEYFFYI